MHLSPGARYSRSHLPEMSLFNDQCPSEHILRRLVLGAVAL
jgi:hypothetical protein